MPKIIENIREKLLSEAKHQVLENGYTSMTIRSVATACGVGVGTVYNYFPSKDMLVASFMLEDWMLCLEAIEQGQQKAKNAKDALYCIYIELQNYKEKFKTLFMDENAEASYSASSHQRHGILRTQLATPIRKWTGQQDRVDAEFLADFIAENMLIWTMKDYTFEQISDVLLQLL